MKKNKISLLVAVLLTGLLLSGCDLIATTPDPTPIPTPVVDRGVIAEANLVPEALEAQILSAQLAVLQAEQQLSDLHKNADFVSVQAQVAWITAKDALLDAERNWDAIDTDAFFDELDDARIEMIEALEERQDAEEKLADYQDLDEDNPVRVGYEEDLEEAQQAYDEARWDFEELQNQYDLAEAQLEAAREAMADAERRMEAAQQRPDPDDLELANASLDQARGQQRAAERALVDVELIAPFDGRVVRLDLVKGAQTSPGQIAMVLADLSEWYLETNDLTEVEVIQIAVGDEVTITFDALPGDAFTGEVVSISDYFLESFGDITYVVRIRLQEPDERLRWGMTAEVSFSD